MIDQDKLNEMIGRAAWEAGKKFGKDLAKALGKDIKFFDPHIEGEDRGWMIEEFCSGGYYQLDAIKNKTK